MERLTFCQRAMPDQGALKAPESSTVTVSAETLLTIAADPKRLGVKKVCDFPNGDAVADIAYRVRFSSSADGRQTATVRRVEGAQATETGACRRTGSIRPLRAYEHSLTSNPVAVDYGARRESRLGPWDDSV
jgi:hypothetical protein